MHPPEHQSPINPMPPVIVALFLFMMGIEVVFYLGARGLVGGPEAIGWRQEALQRYAFSGDIFDWMLANGIWPAEHLIRFVSYMFLHGGFTHALFAGAMFLALGKMVGERFSSLATLLVFISSGVVGALAYGLVLNNPVPLIGAFPGVYGLIGAFTYLMWVRLGEIGEAQARAFTLIGVLLGIQLLFGFLFGGRGDWLADVAGFVNGFVLSVVVSPGGWAKLRARMKRD